MRIIPRASFVEKPWRNGGGVSWEALADPGGDWSLNLAEIAKAGPFSDYAGFDRTLTVVRGEGLSLNAHRLGAEPFSFDGGAPVLANVAGGGPVLVFNALTRRGAFRHAVRRTARPEGDFAVPLDSLDLLVLEAGVAQKAGEGAFLSVALARA